MTESAARITESVQATEAERTPAPTECLREIRFRHSKHFVPILQQLQTSLLVSTYAAGKLAAVGVSQGGNSNCRFTTSNKR